ncbi:uncharacterized protein LOC108940840 [Scleropages formosus]|uniref:uncharacterized protein LOC108940840 n=1 Tax=Scleropages formosus TaxID=113540 RepID=UPI00087868EE|nr:uncharacterized protein LOC108940840 [Scleropages formosus]
MSAQHRGWVRPSVKKMEMFMALEKKNRAILVKSSKIFIEKSLHFISSLMKYKKLASQQGQSYMQEILHSIFFLGLINRPRINPEDVLNEELALKLRQKFPDAFQIYRTKLPSRPPYSILLDVVVEITGDQDVPAVQKKLLDLNAKMHVPKLREDGTVCGNDFTLASTVVSYCYFSDSQQKTKNYFGVSVACKGGFQRSIFIDQACITTWNRNVAFAVCLADSESKSIQLPKSVFSAAFHMLNNLPQRTASNSNTPTQRYYSKPPCLKCLKIFPNVVFLPPPENNDTPAYWMSGNCAECEAISKLLNAESWVNDRVEFDPTVPTLEELLHERKERLYQNLRKTPFEV